MTEVTFEEAQRVEPLGTRAVMRAPLSGTIATCVICEQAVGYIAPTAAKKLGRNALAVVCNVYEGPNWDRVDWFHAVCYDIAGQPHGNVRDHAPGEVDDGGEGIRRGKLYKKK